MSRDSQIKDLTGLLHYGKKGLHKKGLLKSQEQYTVLCDYMQKINYSVQDMNYELPSLENVDRKSCMYIIVLATWIQEAFEKIMKCFKEEVLAGFSYEKEEEIKDAKAYINAIRSFVVAHPLSTSRHGNFGLDGNYICIDIANRKKDLKYFLMHTSVWSIDFTGLHEGENDDADIVLYVYSEKTDGMRFYQFILVNLCDVYSVADLYVEKLYALDKYLMKLKCRDFK